MIEAMKLVEHELHEVDDCIRSVFLHEIPVVRNIVDQVFSTAGKRMRPALLLLTAKLFNGITEDAIGAAAVIEVVHAASLLHDDVVDDTIVRRGSDSMNARMNNKISILIGDFLFGRAYTKISRLSDRRVASAIAEAVARMSLGQMLEAYFQGEAETSLSEYYSIIEGKTASLFSTSTKVGAIIGSASDGHIKAMAEFGKNFGMAFQVIDDYLDLWGNEAKMGKPAGSDLKEKKYTLPVLYLLDKAEEEDKTRVREILSSSVLEKSGIEEILAVLNRYGAKEFSYGVAAGFMEKACASLNGSFESKARRAIDGLIDFTLHRES
jgi:octaprenyl-diphosphate synthase